MCLAVPAKVISRQDFMATVSVSEVQRQVSLMLLPEAAVGDWVLIHAGFAVQLINEEEAAKTMELFREISEYEQPDG